MDLAHCHFDLEPGERFRLRSAPVHAQSPQNAPRASYTGWFILSPMASHTCGFYDEEGGQGGGVDMDDIQAARAATARR